MKLLIVRFSSIGDIVLTSPIPRIAKSQLGATVHYVTKAKFTSLLDKNPNIEKVYYFNQNINEIIPFLKEEKYDFVIDLHNNLRSNILISKLRIKAYRLDKKNWDKWLMVNFNKRIAISHIVDRYIDTIKPLGGKNDGKGLEFYYNIDTQFTSHFMVPAKYICISMGAKHFTKKIPIDLLIKIISNTENNIVLIGGKDVIEDAFKIENSIDKPIINLVGKISLQQSAQIIDNSQKVLTSDTGMMHIAAALKKETIVLWGNTVPEFGMYPYYGDINVKTTNFEVVGLRCRPCSKIGFNACPKEHFKCMNEQHLEEIINNLN